MLTPKLPTGQKSLAVTPQKVRIVLDEDSNRPLAFVLPPVDDIGEIEELRGSSFSLDEHAEQRIAETAMIFADELGAMRTKYDRFSSSPVYLHRLATLMAYAGRRDEFAFRRRAYELAASPFYAHSLGDELASTSGIDAAEEFFSSIQLTNDAGTHLRLASFAVQRGQFDRADKFVKDALEVDPIDFAARLFDGGLSLFRSDCQRAIQSFRIALRERPTSSSAHCNLAIAYLGVREEAKALGALKRAAALDPLSSNAVCLLSDVAFRLKRDEEAVPSLRYFVQFEQKNEEIWSRLARACFKIGRHEEAVAALKRQASIRDSAGVWNNLGVAYLKLNNSGKGLESFVHAMRLGEADRGRDYCLAARNAVCLLSERSAYQELRKLVLSTLKSDDQGWIVKDEEISDILPFFINSLYQLGYRKEAAKLAHDVLATEGICDALAIWLVGALVGYQALSGESPEVVVELVVDNEEQLWPIATSDGDKYSMFFNNVAFALAEMGHVAKAEQYIGRILHLVHKSPYPTATFGLIQFKKGRVERAKALYDEAVSIAVSKRDKTRIRQKMNIELAKVLMLEGSVGRARRVLERVASERGGEDTLVKQARGMLATLVGARSK